MEATGPPKYEESPLLSASKQIRSEASAMYYTDDSTLGIELGSKQLPGFTRKCTDIVDLCGNRPFQKLRICFLNSRRSLLSELHGLLPLLELMRDTGFEPDKEHYRQGDPVFQAEKERSGKSGRSLFLSQVNTQPAEAYGRAFALGRRARDEEWSWSKLESRFEEFVTNLCRAKWPAMF